MQRDVVEIRTNVDQVSSHLQRAGRDLADAGGASAALARDVAGQATERARDVVGAVRETAGDVVERAQEQAGEAASAVGERASEAASTVAETAERAAVTAGRAAIGVTVTALNLPEIVRESARRGIEMAENVGTQIAASMLNAGSRALTAAADYVNEIVPRRRVRRQALEQLLLEQIAWAQAGTDALERTAGDIDDDGLRVQLVRSKLQTIRHAETLTQVLGRIGGRMRTPERMPRVQPARIEGADHPGNGRVRHDLASALSCAEQQAAGWRALSQIAAAAEPEHVATAIGNACEVVGREADEQVEMLRDATMRRTVDAVLG